MLRLGDRESTAFPETHEGKKTLTQENGTDLSVSDSKRRAGRKAANDEANAA